MKKIKQLALALTLTLALFGCRKDNPISLQAEDRYLAYGYTENYWSKLFDDFWELMNQSYVLWIEEEELDWDEIYTEYYPKFVAIDEWQAEEDSDYDDPTHSLYGYNGSLLSKGDSVAVATYKEITTQISDYHYVLGLKGPEVYLGAKGYYEVSSRDYYHASDYSSFNNGIKTTITQGIADGQITDYCAGTYYDYDYPSTPLSLYSYRQSDDIAYFRLSHWSISNSSDTAMFRSEDSITEVVDNFENIIRNTPNLKGAIFDVRCNGGGYLADLDYIMGRFTNVDESITIGHTRHKSGPNRLDYTSYIPELLFGTSEQESVRFPIAVLVDVNSISMSEMVGFFAKEFSPESVIVGERTYGATCCLADEMYLAGGFVESGSLLLYTVSAACYYGADNGFYEGVGLTPDIEVFYDAEWGTTTTDSQKEAAITYLKSL